MDFVHDQLATGGKFRIPTAIDTSCRYVRVVVPRSAYQGSLGLHLAIVDASEQRAEASRARFSPAIQPPPLVPSARHAVPNNYPETMDRNALVRGWCFRCVSVSPADLAPRDRGVVVEPQGFIQRRVLRIELKKSRNSCL